MLRLEDYGTHTNNKIQKDAIKPNQTSPPKHYPFANTEIHNQK